MMTDRKTAAELMAELNSDPEYLARKQVQEEARQKLLIERAKEEAPVVDALRSACVDVRSIWDLSSGEKVYSEAIPVLFEQLKKDYPDHVREGILRALATPLALSRWDELVRVFEDNTANLPPELRYVAALALSGAADDSVLDDVLRLVNDKKLGLDRAPLLIPLIRSKAPRAKMALLELRQDPELGKEIKKMRRLERHRSNN